MSKLQKISNTNCVGFDINSYGWDTNKELYQKIKLFSGTKEEINFERKFHTITLWHSLEHEFEPRELLTFLNKITTHDATLVIEVPNYNSLTRLIQNKYWAGYHTPRHSVVYTPETLKRLLEDFGWKVEKFYKYGTMDAFTLWWLGQLEKTASKKKITKVNLEKYFFNYLLFKIILLPFFLFEKLFSFGIMTVVFKKDIVK